MRLSSVFSKPPSDNPKEIDGFLDGKKLAKGKTRKVSIGNVTLAFFCKACDDTLSFYSSGDLYCIGVDDHSVSLDCILQCPQCNTVHIPAWFLIASEKEIFSRAPEVKILKRSFKLSEHVSWPGSRVSEFEEMLDKASIAYLEGLGAGSVIYLRKILEVITQQVGNVAGVSRNSANGRKKSFKDFLKEVNAQKAFIPIEFSANSYRLFGDLSNVIHGDFEEQIALQKYPALQRLVVGVIENVKNSQEIMTAINALGWNDEGGDL